MVHVFTYMSIPKATAYCKNKRKLPKQVLEMLKLCVLPGNLNKLRYGNKYTAEAYCVHSIRFTNNRIIRFRIYVSVSMWNLHTQVKFVLICQPIYRYIMLFCFFFACLHDENEITTR